VKGRAKATMKDKCESVKEKAEEKDEGKVEGVRGQVVWEMVREKEVGKEKV
jgi:hypothetical protein